MTRPYNDGALRRGCRYLTATQRLTLRLTYLLRPDLSLAKIGIPYGLMAQSVYAATSKKGIGRITATDADDAGWAQLIGKLRSAYEAERVDREAMWPLGLLQAFQQWQQINATNLAGGQL